MKKAFTLAEILITLTIVGVIAAVAIPAVVQNAQSQEAVAKLRKAYNTLKAVQRNAELEYGSMENWGWSGDSEQDFNSFLKQYFDILKDCKTDVSSGCFASSYTHPDGGVWSNAFNDGVADYAKIITSDGIAFAFASRTEEHRKGVVYVDINGPKGPNRLGRDLFHFFVFSSSLGVKPQGSYNLSTGELLSTSLCTSKNGQECTAKVLSEGVVSY